MTHWFSSASLRFRLSVLFSLTFLLSASVLLLVLAQRHVAFSDGLVHDQAEELAANIATLTRAEVAANDRIALSIRLESFNEFQHLRSIVIADRQGNPLAAVTRNAAGNLSATPRRRISPDNGSTASRGSKPGTATIRAAIGQIAPIGWVDLEIETTRTDAQRNRVLGGIALAAILVWVGATFAFALCLGPLLRPHAAEEPASPDSVERARDG
ncbi:MAG TPA: hypothetical protein PK725_04105 [Rhodocyclaceae bacterium]|nr:hypothetical protein [Rhodocyclaceae bacterium]